MGAEESRPRVEPAGWRPVSTPFNSGPPSVLSPFSVIPGSEVILHVYDLDGSSELSLLNGLLRPLGTGIFHCGVEVFNREWSYRGSNREGTGVFSCMPGHCSNLRSRESVVLGRTHLNQEQVVQTIKTLEVEWPCRGYDILRRNCSHFVEIFCRHLGVAPIPEWVKNMASAGAGLAEIGGAASSLASRIGEALGGSLEQGCAPPGQPYVSRAATAPAGYLGDFRSPPTDRVPYSDLRSPLRRPAMPGRPRSPPPAMKVLPEELPRRGYSGYGHRPPMMEPPVQRTVWLS